MTKKNTIDKKPQQVPDFQLDPQEKVVLEISRSKFGLIPIWGASVFMLIVIGIVIIAISSTNIAATAPLTHFIKDLLVIVFILLIVVGLAIGLIGTKVYKSNRLYITNKRIIQVTSKSLFAKSVNIIELSRIEDVSFSQNGIFNNIFHMGTLRMSTVGDETTYTFPFTDTPTDEVETIAKLIQDNKTSD